MLVLLFKDECNKRSSWDVYYNSTFDQYIPSSCIGLFQGGARLMQVLAHEDVRDEKSKRHKIFLLLHNQES